MNVTVLTEAMRGVFGFDHGQMEAHLSAAPAGADGLTFLPYLNGERTPNLPKGSGVLHGMRTDNLTPAHLMRAAVEGVTIGLAYGLKRFETLGVTPTEIRITGGGSRSAGWRQVVADVFGVPVVSLATAEGAGLGAALQAAYVVQHAADSKVTLAGLADRLVSIDESSRALPNAALKDLYAAQLERQMGLTQTLKSAGWL
jgi:xylulokinase